MGKRQVEQIFTKGGSNFNKNLRDSFVRYGNMKAIKWFFIGVISTILFLIWLKNKGIIQ